MPISASLSVPWGVGLSTAYDAQRDVRMAPGDSAEVSGYQFDFVSLTQIQGPNFSAYRGEILVMSGGKVVATMLPEKRSYRAGGQVMTEAGN